MGRQVGGYIKASMFFLHQSRGQSKKTSYPFPSQQYCNIEHKKCIRSWNRWICNRNLQDLMFPKQTWSHRQTSEHRAWSQPSCWGGRRGGRAGRRPRRSWWTQTGEPSQGTPGTGPHCPPGSSLGWFASSPRRLFLVQDAEIWRCLEFSLR